MRVPEIIFSKRCSPGLALAASMAASKAFMLAAVSRLPHSVLMTISSDGAPAHLPTLAVFSM